MLNIFGKLTTKNIFIICGSLLVGMIAVIVLYIYQLLPEIVFTILMFLMLVTFSSLISTMINRRMEKKMFDKKKSQLYKYCGELEFDKNLKSLKANYGTVNLYLENKVLYVTNHKSMISR